MGIQLLIILHLGSFYISKFFEVKFAVWGQYKTKNRINGFNLSTILHWVLKGRPMLTFWMAFGEKFDLLKK